MKSLRGFDWKTDINFEKLTDVVNLAKKSKWLIRIKTQY